MADLLERVAASGLVGPADDVLVLLSGGADSTCLLDCVARLAATARALHVDYGLREGSGADAEACSALCARLGVELEVLRVHRPRDATGNLQAWARDVRYAEGARRATTSGSLLAAGHTASDQAETVLYRLATSPGRRALLGMPARSGRLVRPLLEVAREDTAAHCAARGLAFVTDPSNATGRFARGRVRHGLLAALREVDERAEASIVRTAGLLREEAEVLDDVVDTALAGRSDIPLTTLAALPRALGRLVLRRLAEACTNGLCPRASSRLDDVLALGAADGGPRALDLGDGARAEVRRGVLRVVPTPPLPARTP